MSSLVRTTSHYPGRNPLPPTEEVPEDLEALCDFVGHDKVEITVLSNGKRALKDIKSGELIHIEDGENSESDDEGEDPRSEPEEESEGEEPDHSTKTPPLVIELHKNQTPKAVEGMLLKTSEVLNEKAGMVTRVQVVIEGFSADISPAMYRPAKKRYVKACEMGLLGLLHIFGFTQEVITVYATAYCKTKIKSGNVVAKGIVSESERKLFSERMQTSMLAYKNLIERHSKTSTGASEDGDRKSSPETR